MKPSFTPAIIGELRNRVVAHNREVSDPDLQVKLGPMKGMYKAYHGGRDPHAHALAKIDQHLAALRDKGLEKARPPERFDPGEHPRGGGGRFAPVPADPALLTAAQTQVIPETRYTTLGVPIAGAAGVALGAASGATAKFGGTRVDHTLTGATRWAGGKMVSGVAEAMAASAIRTGRGVTRAAVRRINRVGRTAIPVPGPAAGETAIARITNAAELAGRYVGEKVGHAASFVGNAPAAVVRQSLEHHVGPGLRGRVTGRIGGALVGAAIPGALYAAAAMHVQRGVGPIADVAFPRRVRKSDGNFVEEDEILAKVAELLDGDLAKADIIRVARGLASNAGHYLGPRISGAAARIRGAFRRAPIPAAAAPAASTAVTPPLKGKAAVAAALAQAMKDRAATGGRAAAEHVVGASEAAAAKPKPAVPAIAGSADLPGTPGRPRVPPLDVASVLAPRRHATALNVARRIIPLTAVGGGLGAGGGVLTQYGMDRFNELHPRDSRGRWAKGRGAVIGARVGAVAGLGLAVVSGVVSARHGRTQLIRAAIQRIGGEVAEMRTAAAEHARNAHATAWSDTHKDLVHGVEAKHPAFAPGTVITPTAVQGAIELQAVKDWSATEGRAIKGGARQWYKYQNDLAFDEAALRELRKFGRVLGKDGKPVTADLIHKVDPSKLNPDQRKLWDGLDPKNPDAVLAPEVGEATLRGRHAAAHRDVDEVWEKRQAVADKIEREATEAKGEKGKLLDALGYVRNRAAELDQSNAPIKDIKAFAHQHLGYEIKSTKRSDAMEELPVAIQAWEGRTNQRLAELATEIPAKEKDLKTAAAAINTDVADADRMAIRNRFSASKKQVFFEPLPEHAAVEKAVKETASKPFLEENNAHAEAAVGHLDTLVAAHEAALQGGLAPPGIVTRTFKKQAPLLSARLGQAVLDLDDLMNAHRGALTGLPKSVADFVHQNRNWNAGWKTTKLLGEKSIVKAKAVENFVFQHYKAASTLAGIAATVGFIDIDAGGGKTVRIDPRTWHRPAEMHREHEYPNPIDRPDELVTGLSFKDKDGQRKFLRGYWATGPGQFQVIPYGANVAQVVNRIRQGKGQGDGQHKPVPIVVKDPKDLQTAIDRLRNEHKLTKTGPNGAEFWERNGDDTPDKRETEVADSFYKQHLEDLERFGGKSTNQPARYWDSLIALFGQQASIMNRRTRVALLIGGDGRKRGIFANADGDLTKTNDKSKVIAELTRQINEQGGSLRPKDQAEALALRRAFWLVGNRAKFSADDHALIAQKIKDAIDNAGNPTGTTRKAEPAPALLTGEVIPPEAAGSLGRSQALQDELIDRYPDGMRKPAYKTDEQFGQALHGLYRRYVSQEREQTPDASEERIHAAAAGRVRKKAAEWIVLKQVATGGLRKFLVISPRFPPISPLRKARSANAGLPPINGSARARAGNYLRGEARPARALSQLGTYGLGQAGYAAASFIGKTYFPGAGAAVSAAKFIGDSVGAIGGGLGGQIGGQKLGEKLGGGPARGMDDNEGLTRSMAGSAGAIGGVRYGTAAARGGIGAAGKLLARDAGKVASFPGRVAGAIGRKFTGGAVKEAGAAALKVGEKGVAERIGGAIGGDLGEVAGGAAGTSIGPEGTAAGGVGGFMAGQAIGAGVGWLADEGVGLLYHHLSGYGPHISHMAAKQLGVPAAKRARFGGQGNAASTAPAGATAMPALTRPTASARPSRVPPISRATAPRGAPRITGAAFA